MSTKRLEGERYRAINAAKGLLYGADVIERLENATSEPEIERILTTARRRKTREEDNILDHEIEKRRHGLQRV